MSPKAIVEKSLEAGLDIIAVCDHNSAENVEAAVKSGEQHGLTVLPGMEINSREEAHILALFEGPDEAFLMQEIVYANLKGTNSPEIFGDQVVVNEKDEVEGFNAKMLIGAIELGLYEIVTEIHRLGGLVIASHIDRPSFSIVSQLGFIPRDLELDAVEISRANRDRMGECFVTDTGDLPRVTFSDAHMIDDIGGTYTSFSLVKPSIREIRMALRGESGRGVSAA
jgi:predicted metal-dependent phosphoesterase TrpH